MGMLCWEAKGIPLGPTYLQKGLNEAEMKCLESVFPQNKGFLGLWVWFKFPLKPHQGELLVLPL